MQLLCFNKYGACLKRDDIWFYQKLHQNLVDIDPISIIFESTHYCECRNWKLICSALLLLEITEMVFQGNNKVKFLCYSNYFHPNMLKT